MIKECFKWYPLEAVQPQPRLSSGAGTTATVVIPWGQYNRNRGCPLWAIQPQPRLCSGGSTTAVILWGSTTATAVILWGQYNRNRGYALETQQYNRGYPLGT